MSRSAAAPPVRRDPSRRGEAVLAGVAVGLAFVLGVAALVWWDTPDVPATVAATLSLCVGVVTCGVAAVIVVRRPGNVIGRLLLAAGLAYQVSNAAWTAAERFAGDVLTVWTAVAAIVGGWAWMPMFLCLLILLPLLYPDGYLAGPRWRWIAWSGVGVVVALTVVAVVEPGPLVVEGREVAFDNPLAFAEREVVVAVQGWLINAMLLLVPAALSSLVVRYRRSGPVVRQQVKWLAFAVGAVIALTVASDRLAEVTPWFVWIQGNFYVVFLLVPIAIAIAVLRHGLYEIDRIISRTLAWALLTVAVIVTYAGVTIGLGAVVRAATGSAASDLVVAASTLVVAAMFQPTRRRIQRGVDRRFNRARYDAEAAVASFVQHLRDEVDLRAVTSSLCDVAARSLQPAHVTLWLPTARTDGEAPDDGRRRNDAATRGA